MNSFKQNRLYLFISFFIPVAVYLQTTGFGFVYFDDNKLILDNFQFLSDFRNVDNAFATDAFITKTSYFYRPIQVISYMIDIGISGGAYPWMFHVSNVLLFGINGLLLFLLLERLLNQQKLALAGSLLYCIHPLFGFTVSWIPARGDLLLAMFSLLSWILLLDYHKKYSVLLMLPHWLCYTAALFCKETAMVLPLLFILYSYLFDRQRSRSVRILWILYALSLTGWFFLRTHALDDISSENAIAGLLMHDEVVGLHPLISNLRTFPEALFKFFIPVKIEPIPGFTWIRTSGGLLILAILLMLVYKSDHTHRNAKLFGLIWFILLLMPTMLFKHKAIDYLDHRFLLPLIGILLIILLSIPQKWIHHSGFMVVVISTAVLLSSISFVNARSYKNTTVFFNDAIRKNPRCTIAYVNRGVGYQNSGNIEKALDDYNMAIQLSPGYSGTFVNRANLFLSRKMYQQAVSDYTSAIQLGETDPFIFNNRGISFIRLGLKDQACADFIMAAREGNKRALENLQRFCNLSFKQ